MTRNRECGVAKVLLTSDRFDGCNELVLWDPQLPPSQRQRAVRRASRKFRQVVTRVVGAGLIALVLVCSVAVSWRFALSIGIILVSAYGAVVVGIEWFATSAGNLGQRARHRSTLLPGELFYRPADFAELKPPIRNAAAEVIATAHRLQLSPARHWLGTDVVQDAQQVAWDTLSLVYRSRTARVLVDQAGGIAELAELTASAHGVIAKIDRALVEVVTHLRNTLALADAWGDKLSHIDLRTRITDNIDQLGYQQTDLLADRSETLSRDVFAFVTAARDVLDAGSFPWERASPQSRQRAVIRVAFRAVRALKARTGETS